MNKANNTIKQRIFDGAVLSDKMEKTVVVKVDSIKFNSKYKKHYISSRKYKVHDEKNKYKEGDKVQFVECRPYSKDKKWRAL